MFRFQALLQYSHCPKGEKYAGARIRFICGEIHAAVPLQTAPADRAGSSHAAAADLFGVP